MKDFFKNIKWLQILAGALAAVTSFLLMNRIGIAGSVIGAAVASIVTALATQIYQNVLNVSHDKVQEQLGRDDSKNDAKDGAASADPRTRRAPRAAVGTATRLNSAARLDKTAIMPAVLPAAPSQNPSQGASSQNLDATQAMPGVTDEDFGSAATPAAAGSDETIVLDPLTGEPLAAEPPAASGTLYGATGDGARAIASQSDGYDAAGYADASGESGAGKKGLSNKTKLFIVALVCSVVAVILTAVVIQFATGGEGLGSKPADVHPAPQVVVTTTYETTDGEDSSSEETPFDESTDEQTDAPSETFESASSTPSASESKTAQSTPSASVSQSSSVTSSPSASASSSSSPSASASASSGSSASASSTADPQADAAEQ
ncbi:hypothetical protein [Pseudoscardovia radai]|uniref:hypothetical protein n=1 Tax=Pseudoscardovia radai TaxID=987066 RepID=UPI003992609D